MGFDFISKSFTFVKFGKSDTLTSHFTLWQLSQIFLAQRSQYLSWLKCLLRSATGVTSAQVSALLHQRSGLPEFLAWHVKTDWLARLLGPGYNRDQQLSCRQHQGCIVASDDTPVTMHHIPAPSSCHPWNIVTICRSAPEYFPVTNSHVATGQAITSCAQWGPSPAPLQVPGLSLTAATLTTAFLWAEEGTACASRPLICWYTGVGSDHLFNYPTLKLGWKIKNSQS